MRDTTFRRLATVLVIVAILVSTVPFSAFADTATATDESGFYGFEDGTIQGWNHEEVPGRGPLNVISGSRVINGSYSVEMNDQSSNGAYHALRSNNMYESFSITFTARKYFDESTGVKDNFVFVKFGGQETGDYSAAGYAKDYYNVVYGNLGGTDDPHLAILDPAGNVLTSKNVAPPNDGNFTVRVTVNSTGYVEFTSYDGDSVNDPVLHTISLDTDAQTGHVGFGIKSGAGATGAYVFDDVHFSPSGKFNSEARADGDGRPIAPNPLLNYTEGATDAIKKKHDLLNDSDNYVKIVNADVQEVNESANEWASAGAGAIYNHTTASGGTTWYLSLRQRTPSQRGKSFEIYKNDGNLREPAEWGMIFEEDMKDDVQSVEGSILREYNGKWYFYFSYDDPTPNEKINWVTSYVTADTVAGLEAKLDDPTTWTDLTHDGPGGSYVGGFATSGDGGNFEKDPRVFRWGGYYYLLTGYAEDTGSSNNAALYRDENPNFTSATYLGDPHGDILAEKPGSQSTLNAGTIMFDKSSDRFIYWTNYFNHTSGKNEWVYAVSTNLRDWEYVDDENTGDLVTGFTAPRYMDYALGGVAGGSGVIMMEWDPQSDGVANLYLWDYAPNLETLVPQYTVNGTVTDSSGDPVESVTITAIKNSTILNQTTTNAQGEYSFTLEENQNVTLKAEKSGYTTESKEVDVTSDQTVNFVMGSVSLTGVVTDNETGAAIEGASVTVTRQSDGAVIATTTTNSSGGYSVGVVEGTTYNVEVSATGYGGETKTVTTSGMTTVLDFQLEPNAVPYLQTASPTSGEYVDTRTVTLKATVTDPEGANVTAYFYMLDSSGTYTLRGSETVPSGGTAEITGVQAEPGQNAWYVKMVDGDGNTDTSPAFLFNTPGSVEIYDATTAPDPENYTHTGKTVTVQISSFESSFAAERTVTDGTLDLTNLPNERMVMTFSASNRTTQRLIVDDTSKQYQVLLYDSANAYTQGFTLDDQTGDFPPSGSHVVIKQRYKGAWRIVGSDAFGGINLAQLELKDGVDYRIEVWNSQGDMRQLGGFTGDSANAGTPTELTISDPTGDVQIERGTRYQWAAYAQNSSGSYTITLDVDLLTSDTSDVTQFDNVTVKMWEYGNRENVIYNSSLGVQQNFTITKTLNKSQYQNKTWVVSWNATLGTDRVGGKKVVGSKKLPTNIPLSPTYKGVVGIVTVLFTGTLFTRANAAFGAFITALVTALMWYLDFMPPAISGSIVVLTLALGVVFIIIQKEDSPA